MQQYWFPIFGFSSCHLSFMHQLFDHPYHKGKLKREKKTKFKQIVLRCNSVPPPLKWQSPKQIHSQLGFYGTVGHENHQLAAKLLSKPNLGDENVWNTRSISQIVKWHVYFKKETQKTKQCWQKIAVRAPRLPGCPGTAHCQTRADTQHLRQGAGQNPAGL